MSSARSPPKLGDAATVTVQVAVAQEDAFEVFTKEIDLWWRTGPRFRIAGKRRGTLFFEGRVGGRLFETFEVSSGSRAVEVGRVTAWSPPDRLELEWRGVNYEPHEKTFVEVTFAPLGDGTSVTVRHYGLSALPDDHPARHGALGQDFTRKTGLWWSDLLTSLRELVAARRGRDG